MRFLEKIFTSRQEELDSIRLNQDIYEMLEPLVRVNGKFNYDIIQCRESLIKGDRYSALYALTLHLLKNTHEKNS